ncbi:MAG: A24 family peptidase [Bacillota bacterium]
MWQEAAGVLLGGTLALTGAAVSPRWMARRPRAWEVGACALAGGLVALLVLKRAPGLGAALPQILLAAVLITASLVDLHERIIPNELVLVTVAAWPVLHLLAPRFSWAWALGGAALGGGTLLLVALASRGGMGMGDVKLAGAFGLYLGLSETFVALAAAFLLGGLVSLALLALGVVGRKDHIPFGPFLAAGALVGLLYGDPLFRVLGY